MIEELSRKWKAKDPEAGSQAPTVDEDKEEATEGTTPAGAGSRRGEDLRENEHAVPQARTTT